MPINTVVIIWLVGALFGSMLFLHLPLHRLFSGHCQQKMPVCFYKDCSLVTIYGALWLPKTSSVMIPLTLLLKLSCGPGLRTIALPLLSTLLGLFKSRAC